MFKFRSISIHSFALTALCAVLASGCTSKFGDKSPESQNTNGFSASDRIMGDEQLDKKLNRIDDAADKVRKLIKLFGQTQKAEAGEDVYTQLDFLLDVNDQLKKSPAEMKEGRFVRTGQIKMNIKGLSPECQIVDTRLETRSQGGKVDLPMDQQWNQVDAIIYSVRTCTTRGEMLPIVEIEVSKSGDRMKFNNHNLKVALADTLIPALTADTGCTFEVDEQEILSGARCENLVTKVSASEKLNFEKVVFSRSDEIRFSLNGKVYENDAVKATLEFQINSQGKPTYKVEKLK